MKSMLLTLMAFAATNTFAAQTKIELITCEGKKTAKVQDFESQIYMNIKDMNINDDKATIKSYTFTVVNKDVKSYGVMPANATSTSQGENISNVEYDGRKYPDHLKFHVDSGKGIQTIGDQEVQYANLIIAPEYTVAKTVHEHNEWDKTWTWDIEIRKHSAVLDVSFNDHHGDYIKLDCYSIASVNDSKGRH